MPRFILVKKARPLREGAGGHNYYLRRNAPRFNTGVDIRDFSLATPTKHRRVQVSSAFWPKNRALLGDGFAPVGEGDGAGITIHKVDVALADTITDLEFGIVGDRLLAGLLANGAQQVFNLAGRWFTHGDFWAWLV